MIIRTDIHGVKIEWEADEGGMLFCPPGLIGPGAELMPKAPPCLVCGSAVLALWMVQRDYGDDIWGQARPTHRPLRIQALVPCFHEVDSVYLVRREGQPNVYDVAEWRLK